jgi:hypothetical protein
MINNIRFGIQNLLKRVDASPKVWDQYFNSGFWNLHADRSDGLCKMPGTSVSQIIPGNRSNHYMLQTQLPGG